MIIDEAGLNSLREGVEILQVARQNGYRVLLVGDARQHNAVESGDFFRLLEDYSEIDKFSLTDIYRQQNEEYRRGIMECALGQHAEAFDRFDANHFIHEGRGSYLKNAAQSYMDFTDNGKNISQAILVAPTHDEGDRLTDAVREKLKAHGAVEQVGRQVKVFRSWNKEKAWLKNPLNYQVGNTIAFIRNMRGIAHAGETVQVSGMKNGMLHLSNGKSIYSRNAADFIEVGEMRQIELCKGDLIQFNVNLRDRKIYNGNIAQITAVPGQVMMLHADGSPREIVELPPEYSTFKYGWVTTSHKSQGRTAENVVVAAQAMDRKAFYVALSRGRKFLALHCPDKEFLKEQLINRKSERLGIHDLIRDREISPNAILPLSAQVREAKEKTLPDMTYKTIAERAAALLRKVKCAAKNLFANARKVEAEKARRAKYGYGIVTEETYFEQDRLFAFEKTGEVKPDEPKVPKQLRGLYEMINDKLGQSEPKQKMEEKVETVKSKEYHSALTSAYIERQMQDIQKKASPIKKSLKQLDATSLEAKQKLKELASQKPDYPKIKRENISDASAKEMAQYIEQMKRKAKSFIKPPMPSPEVPAPAIEPEPSVPAIPPEAMIEQEVKKAPLPKTPPKPKKPKPRGMDL